MTSLSVVAPAFNEERNVGPLVREIHQALRPLGLPYEIILVNDGSTDGTGPAIDRLASMDRAVRAVHLKANRGQTAALHAGFQAARSDLVATLDADLQNDPADLPKLLQALGDHQAAVGFRAERHDNWLRRVSSAVANIVRNRLTGDSIRDTGCSLKLFRAGLLRKLPLFDGMHRFLPTLIRIHGGTVVELPVNHRPRRSGASKYNVRNRILRSCFDLLAVRWMKNRVIEYEVNQDER